MNKVDWIKLEKQFNDLGEKSIAFLKSVITDNNKIATGELINSLSYQVIKETNGFLLKIIASDHYKYVDEGRKSGSKAPPKPIIVSWMKSKGIKPYEGSSYSSAAFIISRSISQKGIKPLRMTDKLVYQADFMKNKESLLAFAANDDLKQYIKDMLLDK